MKWLCVVSMLSGLAISPVFAQESSATQGIYAQERDAFVSNLMKQMTLEEKIGQLRLISVGPDNPKEAIRDGISKGQIGAIFNTVTRPDIRVMQDQAMQLSRLKIPCFLLMTWFMASVPYSRSAWGWRRALIWRLSP